MVYYVYLARCRDQSLYAGICLDPNEREKIHNSGKGAKYTRSRLPIRFVFIEQCTSKSIALKREAAIKRLKKAEKEKLLTSHSTHRSKLLR